MSVNNNYPASAPLNIANAIRQMRKHGYLLAQHSAAVQRDDAFRDRQARELACIFLGVEPTLENVHGADAGVIAHALQNSAYQSQTGLVEQVAR